MMRTYVVSVFRGGTVKHLPIQAAHWVDALLRAGKDADLVRARVLVRPV